MGTVNCPFCGAKYNGIVDLELYEDGEQEVAFCDNCDETFVVKCAITIDYTAYCKKGCHDFIDGEYESEHGKLYNCSRCEAFEFRENGKSTGELL